MLGWVLLASQHFPSTKNADGKATTRGYFVEWFINSPIKDHRSKRKRNGLEKRAVVKSNWLVDDVKAPQKDRLFGPQKWPPDSSP